MIADPKGFEFDEELTAILRLIEKAPKHLKPSLVQAAIIHMQKKEQEKLREDQRKG